MAAVIYLETSAVLRAVLERSLSPEVEQRLGAARYLVTSRLSLVQSGRALHRLRAPEGHRKARSPTSPVSWTPYGRAA